LSEVRKVKGVSFNYLAFLWSNIGLIRKAQTDGNSEIALKLAATLIAYLPKGIKEDFTKTADEILHSLNMITSGGMKQIADIPDAFQRRRYKQKILRAYSELKLHKLITDLSTTLQERGYMEAVDFADEGFAAGWQEHMKARDKLQGKT